MQVATLLEMLNAHRILKKQNKTSFTDLGATLKHSRKENEVLHTIMLFTYMMKDKEQSVCLFAHPNS